MIYPKGRIEEEAGNKEIIMQRKKLCNVSINSKNQFLVGNMASFYVRDSGDFENKAFYLNSLFDWRIIKDLEGCIILVPLKK